MCIISVYSDIRRSTVLDTNCEPNQLATSSFPLQLFPLAPSQFENLWFTITAVLLVLMVTNLGHIAVNKAVFIIHNEVFEILW